MFYLLSWQENPEGEERVGCSSNEISPSPRPSQKEIASGSASRGISRNSDPPMFEGCASTL